MLNTCAAGPGDDSNSPESFAFFVLFWVHLKLCGPGRPPCEDPNIASLTSRAQTSG